MKQEGHIGLALLLASPVVLILGVIGDEWTILPFLACILWTATLPDIDVVFSKWTGKNGIPVIRNILSIRHRGVTHTVYFGVLLGLICSAGVAIFTSSIPLELISICLLGCTLGVIFHSLGDIITVTGVSIFPPITDVKTFNLCRFDNIIANFGFVITGVSGILLALSYTYQSTIAALAGLAVVYFIVFPLVLLGASKTGWTYSRPTPKWAKMTTISYYLKKIR